MKRSAQFVSQSLRQRDWFAVTISLIAFSIAVWIISMPFCEFTRKQSLRRFHLSNSNFASWAAMAPIPAMYNFENRFQFSNEMIGDGPFDRSHESWIDFPLNHFPARAMTFGDFSPRCFSDVRHGTFEMTSTYQATTLVTRWEISEVTSGGESTLTVHRKSERWDDGDEPK